MRVIRQFSDARRRRRRRRRRCLRFWAPFFAPFCWLTGARRYRPGVGSFPAAPSRRIYCGAPRCSYSANVEQKVTRPDWTVGLGGAGYTQSTRIMGPLWTTFIHRKMVEVHNKYETIHCWPNPIQSNMWCLIELVIYVPLTILISNADF